MQAIARVNRVFKEKQGGLVVDYIGIAENLKEALSKYTDSDKNTTGVDTEVASQVLLEKHDLIKDILHGHDYSKFFTGKPSEKMQAIVETMDYIIELREDRKNDYLKLVTEMSRAYSLCATTEIAESLNVEIGFHKAVKASLVKIISEDNKKKTNFQLDSELNQLISKSISSNEVVDILESVGLSKPNIAILSDEFLEEVKGMKQKNLLLHDASESYIADVTRPVKCNLPGYIDIEEKLQNLIYDKFGIGDLSEVEKSQIENIDDTLLYYEFKELMDTEIFEILPLKSMEQDFSQIPLVGKLFIRKIIRKQMKLINKLWERA